MANEQVRSHNLHVFNSSITEEAIIDASDIVIGDVPDALKEKIKKKIPEDQNRTMGLHSTIAITAGEKYDLTTNVSVSDGRQMVLNIQLKKLITRWRIVTDKSSSGYYLIN